jgi:hypothetical protein
MIDCRPGHRTPVCSRDLLLPRPNSSHGRFARRRNRINVHRNVRGCARNLPVSYAVFVPRICVNPTAIHVGSVTKSRIRLVNYVLLNGIPGGRQLKELRSSALVDFA